ncbi:hypothetical protein [Caballeronia concitans]|uniref:hypothetical protein n=1 Tax=Caballeronia concitans TaxID=1777133 RepID=UPI00117C18B1|nr:hypothetical protein [Caballeronia concitans]
MKNERLMVRIVRTVVVASEFAVAIESAHGQGHCDIADNYTCTVAPCQNNIPGKASVTRLSDGSYLFTNEVGDQANSYEEKPNIYRIPDWRNATAKPDAACHQLIFSNGTHWTR